MIQLVTGSSPVNNPYFCMYDTIDNRVCSREIYREFKDLSLFKNKNNNLVRYSMSNRGNALYFQKIIITKIFRMVSCPFWASNYSSVFDTNGNLNFGGEFQQKYSLITSVQQMKRMFSDTMFGNDSASYGSFKNHFYKSSFNGISAISKKYRESKKTRAYLERSLERLLHLSAGGLFLYNSEVPIASRVAEMKSNYISTVFDNYFSFSLYDSIFNEKFKDKLLTDITKTTFFIRTVWYKSAINLINFNNPFSIFSNTGDYRSEISKSDRYHFRFAGESDVIFFTTLGSWLKNAEALDIAKELKILPRGGVYKRRVKKYIRWRLGITHWGKKILKFKKNYAFWNYARSLSNYFYRGFFMYSIFNCRADVYIMRMFGVKTLKFARLLVQFGHVFRGSFSIRSTFDRIRRYDIVSLSKRANLYLNKKKYFKYWKTNRDFISKKVQNRLIKTSPLMYCRQQKDLSFFGEIKNIKYCMFFGNDISNFNLPSRKTKYFNLNYQYVQKIIASSWW